MTTLPRKARAARGMLGAQHNEAAPRHPRDFYRTPTAATLALLRREFIPQRPGFEVWEPACGDGAISRVLNQHDIRTVSTDRFEYEGQSDPLVGALPGVDFLKQTKLLAPVIITNPPFKIANDFTRHALDLGAEKVCLLLRLAYLEGARRADLWPNLSRVWVFSRRLTLWSGDSARQDLDKGGMMAFAWFVFTKGEPLTTRVGWIADHMGERSDPITRTIHTLNPGDSYAV
jgi:hypothetical protein